MRAAGVALGLAFLMMPLREAVLAIQVPRTEAKKEERKDLKVASSSYAYSKSGDVLGPYEYIDSARYRLHSGGLGRKSLDLGSDEIDASVGSLARNGRKFHLESHGEAEDLLGHDHHEDEHRHHDEEHEKGEKSSEGHESTAKEEGSKGYKVKEKFDKGEKKQKERSKESGHAEEEAGSRVAHEDEAARFREREEAGRAEKGEEFALSEGHKKGHKTTGYHNVYRKDEYKKDTEFYDDEHVDSHREEYRKEDERRAEAEGERERKESLDAAYERGESARGAHFTNAHQYGTARGHEREEALEEHHREDLEARKQSSGSEHAASESSRSHR